MLRRSETGLMLSSIPDDSEDWQEIEADGIYWIDLDQADGFVLKKEPYLCVGSSRRSSRSMSPCELELDSSITNQETGQALLETSDPIDCLHHLLHSALAARLLTILDLNPIHPPESDTGRAKVAVLFSGGIDCTVLARLAHEILDPLEQIDLLNVAFENPRVHRQNKNVGESPYEQCPDRKTARSSLHELRTSCPGRNFRPVRINVPYTDFLKHRPKIIALIRPHNTEMDLSIAAALYFAARGVGLLEDDSLYETSARVLLSGLGADELFAGYTRHATAYSRGGLKALEDELALDISRLGKRNLGRDDRVISHWAKEARYPFLDEDLVKWALSATLFEKCGFGNESLPQDDRGAPLDPAKMVIRCLALKLGMPGVAQEKKRAIQFGARTAKMDVKKTKGTQVLTVMAH
ncbi:Asparagine synthase-like protein 2 [Elsinoe fawcettii]|nr:Asparagine synthase-like protein 2 [Elsinoe fawcettii]